VSTHAPTSPLIDRNGLKPGHGVSLLDLLPPDLQTCPKLWRRCLRVARETCRGIPLFSRKDIRTLARQRYEWATCSRHVAWDGRWTSVNGSAWLRHGRGGKGSPAHRRRAAKRETEYQFVRKCSAKYQARVWCALPVGSVNLGLYDEERAAWDAVKLWLRAGADPTRGLPAKVLPKWVIHGKRPIIEQREAKPDAATADRRRAAERHTGRKVDECSPVAFYAVRKDVVLGPFDDASEAFTAMEKMLREAN
jgi:hypothetical protein